VNDCENPQSGRRRNGDREKRFRFAFPIAMIGKNVFVLPSRSQ
jgi:hypothetical protein